MVMGGVAAIRYVVRGTRFGLFSVTQRWAWLR